MDVTHWLFMALMVALLAGCADFQRTQQAWLSYRYSPAYYDRVYSNTFTNGAGHTTQCYTTVNQLYRTSDTQCY